MKNLINYAREKSPFYRDLYKSLAVNDWQWNEIPIVPLQEFWNANQWNNNKVLTDVVSNGVVFKSGGTTGSPKFSIFTRVEWQDFCAKFGWGMCQGGISANDRVANLFYVGDLYASFMFIEKSLELSPLPVLHLPIAGGLAHDKTWQLIQDFQATVIAGTPTTIMSLFSHPSALKKNSPIKKVLFGGESMFADQSQKLLSEFSEIDICSIGYASVDGGLLGYADASCKDGEHRFFSGDTLIEIVDEDSNEVIEENFRPGKILVTNYRRQLMPIIRYPVGDRGMWVEAPPKSGNRKFKICGRSEEGARVGPVTFYYEDVLTIEQSFDELKGAMIQLEVRHFEQKDQLIVRIATSCSIDEAMFLQRLYKSRSMLDSEVKAGHIHPVKIETVLPEQLKVNHRSGKLKRIIENR